MSQFEIAIELVLAHEGGYMSDPSDPGGATNFGISQRAYPHLNIAALTRDDAIAIYKRDYWKTWMELVNSQPMANCLLDCAVNQGPEVCREMFEETHTLAQLQVARLLHYTQRIATRPEYLKYAHSWFSRTLDVGV